MQRRGETEKHPSVCSFPKRLQWSKARSCFWVSHVVTGSQSFRPSCTALPCDRELQGKWTQTGTPLGSWWMQYQYLASRIFWWSQNRYMHLFVTVMSSRERRKSSHCGFTSQMLESLGPSKTQPEPGNKNITLFDFGGGRIVIHRLSRFIGHVGNIAGRTEFMVMTPCARCDRLHILL